jgi:hypothetical protein
LRPPQADATRKGLLQKQVGGVTSKIGTLQAELVEILFRHAEA